MGAIKKIKRIIIICSLLIVTNAFSQSMDTVRIRKDWVDGCFGYTMTIDKGAYLINDEIIDKESFYFIYNRIDSINKIIRNNTDSYFIFFGPDNKTIIQEGRWDKEFNYGYWKHYYANGKIKEEGYYTELCDSVYYPGQKIGKWKYYYENGNIRNTKYHTPIDRRIKNETSLILPPCTCSQKMLYKNKDCITVPQAKLKGRIYYYSSESIFNNKNDSLFELSFIKEYVSQFMDSMFIKNKCKDECVFVIKIYKHSSQDTVLEFSIDYIMDLDYIKYVNFGNYIIVKNKMVLVKFSKNLRNDQLCSYFRVFESKEYFNKNFPLQKNNESGTYRGNYKLHGNKIQAIISPPWHVNTTAEEDALSDY